MNLLKISSTQDVRFSWGAIEEGQKLANKLWNVSRLILQHAEGLTPELRQYAGLERLQIRSRDRTRDRQTHRDQTRGQVKASQRHCWSTSL